MARPDCSGAAPALALLDHRAGRLLVGHDAQDVARCGHLGEAEDDGRRRWAGLGDPLAAAVLQGADAAVRVADDDDVADLERAGLDEHRGHRAAALVQLRLDDGADGGALGVGLELLDVGDDQDRVEQVVDAGARRAR